MRMVRTTAVLALLGALVLLSACSGSGISSTPASQPAGGGGGSVAAQPPTLDLVEPVAGATVPAGDVTVRVKTTGLEFVMASNTIVAGQGHVHFTLDDKPFQMSIEPEYTFKDVAAGSHRLKAELVQNNTDPFDPPVEQEIEFVVQ